jgi:hypothetical protein
MSNTDSAIAARLVSADFPGAGELRVQVSKSSFKRRDLGGALILEADLPDGLPPAHVDRRVPVEAEGADSDGMTIHFLAHVVGGYLREVEIFREDGEKIRLVPPADSLVVQVFD